MKKNILSSSLLALAATMGAGAAVDTASRMTATTMPPLPAGRGRIRRAYTPRSRGFLYPEQSSRQAMRAHRRQQGGPGIELNTRTGQYEPRQNVIEDSWF